MKYHAGYFIPPTVLNVITVAQQSKSNRKDQQDGIVSDNLLFHFLLTAQHVVAGRCHG
jgi:hypothetical protein